MAFITITELALTTYLLKTVIYYALTSIML